MSGNGRPSFIRNQLILALLVALPSALWADVPSYDEPRFAFDCTATTTTATGMAPFATQLAEAIALKWNLGAIQPGVMESKVTIRVCLSADGHPEQLLLIAAEGPSEDAVTRLFEAARRAIMRADMEGGLPLLPEKYDTWRVLDLVVDANGMRTR